MGNVTQIYSLVNDAVSDFLGSTAVRIKDTSSFVDCGRTLADLHTESNPYAGLDSFFGALACRIAKTEVMTKLYERKKRGVITDLLDFGCFVERVYADVQNAGENFAWSVSNGENPPTIKKKDPYDVTTPINITTKIYGLRGTWAIERVIPYKQIKEAFLSEASMAAFIDSFYTIIATSMNLDMDVLENLAINTGIAMAIHNGQATNLLQVYNTGRPTSLTVSLAMSDADFLAFANSAITKMQKLMEDPSKRFNPAAFTTWTKKEDQKLEVLAEFANASRFKLLANTYNANLASLEGYSEVNAWQGEGKDSYDFESASTIDVKNVGVYADDDTGAAIEVKQTGVLAFLRDKDAVKGYFGEVYTWEIPDVRQRITNHGEEAEIGFAVDPHFNMWVFYIADPVT